MENYALFIYIVCIMAILIVGRMLIFPIKKILKLIINSVLGAGVLYIINIIGANFNFHIGLNWWTIFCTGIFGVPGLVLVIVLKLFG